MLQPTQLAKPIGLTDWAYHWLKRAILSLDLAPGAQLNINTIASELNISRTPIREAFLRLEKDGLVKSIPRIGFYVTEITKRDLEELYEIRELLESRAIEDAVNNLNDQDLRKVDHLIETGFMSIEEKDVDKYLQAEIDFHNFLIEHSRNRHLISIMESLRDLTLRWRNLSLRTFRNLKLSQQEHIDIVAAMKSRDGKKAGEMMSRHIRNSQARILKLVETLSHQDGVMDGRPD
ncbi:MAG: GntR family transcriptional regulator [Acidobacteriaceae bacterium]